MKRQICALKVATLDSPVWDKTMLEDCFRSALTRALSRVKSRHVNFACHMAT